MSVFEASFPIIETNRLRLSTMADVDPSAISELVNDVDVALMLTRAPFPYTREAALDFIQACKDDFTDKVMLYFAVLNKEDDSLVGGAGLFFGDEGWELGYWFGRDHWGQGFGFESASALVDFAFSNKICEQLYASIIVDNFGSIAIIKKLGFQETHDVTVYPENRIGLILDDGTDMSGPVIRHCYTLNNPKKKD
jgi:RimJ/RimL family protein N-acetyltransferase